MTGSTVEWPSQRRRLPRRADLSPLLRFDRPGLGSTTARLAKALTIDDLRILARRRTPRAPFDYTDGGAEGELSIRRARAAFESVEFRPSVLRDVAAVDTSTSVIGAPARLPFGIAPTGFTRMMHTDGEIAGATAAADAGIPFCLSTVGTASPEAVRRASPTGRNWFQLYMWRDRNRSVEVLERAAAAGFEALVVTVDVPVGGARLRDRRNGLTIPPSLGLRTVLDAVPKASWWIDFLTTEPLRFSTFDRWDGTVAELMDSMFDPTVTFDDLGWVAEKWSGPLIVKGVQTVADARRIAELGVDAIVLSNHGGRQLDRAPVPLHLLPEVVAAVGDRVEVHLDTGIRHGADVVAALALGARFTLIGRAYLYGLMAGGRAGVDRALEILTEQLVRTMQLLGVASISELDERHARLLVGCPHPGSPHP